ncbi:CheR family methyltransferase [Marinilabilia sp.]|uniref:CheR family methyltransferase n=1 Tax=Marinilabilia sp. TaxID=2021252 RepID=UPI0025C3DEF2|nr:CheR family methyltransferase [Marinilabilia sp.]
MGVTLGINELKAVTSEMARYENMDYTGLSFSFLKRRLAYVFDKLKVRKLVAFSERLKNNDFRDDVKYYMAVKVTEMFRDPGFWRSVRHNLFPVLGKEFNVWFPDTSSGEELFSFLVLLKENELIDSVKIICQHPSEKLCNEVSEGLLEVKDEELNHSNYKRLEEHDRFETYFKEENGRLNFDKALLKNCHFRIGAPGVAQDDEVFDFIVFRNSGINYAYSRHEELFKNIVEHIRPGGFLAIGVKETIPENLSDFLIVVDKKESIFRKAGKKNE